MESEKFCLRWNDFETSISRAFKELREEKDFFDVTLVCDDSQIEAHKVILSACSPFFRSILRRNPHQHPLLYLKGVKYSELLAVLSFMYMGEVNVAQEELNSFLSVAEELKVKGLTQGNSGHKSSNENTQKQTKKGLTQSDKNLKDLALNPIRKQIYQKDDSYEMQETIPVKAEPEEPPITQPVYTATPCYPTQEHQAEHVLGQQPVVLADSYEAGGEVETYDYHYEEEYGDMSAAGFEPNSSSDVDSVLHAKMSKTAAGEWQCNDCYRTSRFKTNILEHIEATHVETAGYNCHICLKFYKNRHSLRNHMNLKHKELKNIQKEGN